MSTKNQDVQILPKLDSFSLEERTQIEKEIQEILENPPKPEPKDLSHDVFKFTNSSLYESTFLRIYVVKNSESSGFNYRAEVRGDKAMSRSSFCLAHKTYKSKDLK